MDSDVLCACISGLCAVVVALVGTVATRASKRMSEAAENNEKRAQVRKQETMILLEMMDANTQLTVAIANAVLGGHNNGNVEQAREAVKAAQEKYQTFLRDVVAHQMAK